MSEISEISEGMEALREIEVAWLSEQLSTSIANLGYPVGMGMAPHPEQIKKAATILFERYAKMIEMSVAWTRAQSPAHRGDQATSPRTASLCQISNGGHASSACIRSRLQSTATRKPAASA